MTDHSPVCFFAYPSKPLSVAEGIESSIELINGTGVVEAIGWKSLQTTGMIVIDQICEAIDKCDVFICDLTTLNPNVLFEFGYAVAKNKRVWISLDTSYSEAKENYRHFKMLTSIGYAGYHNSRELVNSFLDDQPYANIDVSLLSSFSESIARSGTPALPTLLYLKSPVDTEASIRLTRRLQASPITLITDDPAEVSFQSLAWYIENISYAQALIVHLLDDQRTEEFIYENWKYSFIAGLACALGTNLLMLAHSPFEPPFDYQDLLHVHDSANACVYIVNKWLPIVEREFIARRQKVQKRRIEVDTALALRNMQLGDYMAENEKNELINYFIITAQYTEALNADGTIIYVGQKGSGKTANLYMVANELRRDKRNHVCVLKPVDYDFSGIIELLKATISTSQRGFLFESVWKYMIYSQLAISVYESLINRPVHISRSPEEEIFIKLYELKIDLLERDFSIRLDRIFRGLGDLEFNGSTADQRTRVSEVLHTTELAVLRKQLGIMLENKQKVSVLIDNLDKAWRLGEDLSMLSEFVFGLLGVSESISEEFARSGPAWRPVNLSIIIFLRSDIFLHIMEQTREVDKMPYRRIDWKDKELLLRVIEERLNKSTDRNLESEDIWNTLFTKEVRGVRTPDYITSRIIPRPRDIIFFCKSCLSIAVNRFHSKIEEEDVLQAECEYSQHAYHALVSEVRPRIEKIEELILEFAGSNEVVEHERILALIERAGLSVDIAEDIISILSSSLFLGFEVAANDFRYLYDDSRSEITKSLAANTYENLGIIRYRVNDPFHAYLEIKSDA